MLWIAATMFTVSAGMRCVMIRSWRFTMYRCTHRPMNKFLAAVYPYFSVTILVSRIWPGKALFQITLQQNLVEEFQLLPSRRTAEFVWIAVSLNSHVVHSTHA
ncbi:hypothetical protein [Labrenzia sp. THAF35]|uniref:hypothetical protein n=1 Tax=Labrenzia sp. THAF35 TaxID=2587854 RepID=UPI0025701E3C|nr:hypothetical protein [Labrenzia sp. THAF35]